MSLNVALQSVAFYVLSCSTCSKINHRRKARAIAKRERTEKHALETEQPGLYRHPSPFSTNPYWDEEIMLGPGPPKRKDKGTAGNSKNTSTRALATAGQGSSQDSEGNESTDPGSSTTRVGTDGRLSGDGWNRKRYQREDEELWGRNGSESDAPGAGQRIKDAFARAESSVGITLRLLEGRLSGMMKEDKEERSPYFVAKNPPVNDLHPPVVSTAPTSKEATRWMLQPPPSAKIMEGKERATLDRSGSRGSRGSGRKAVDGENLSRHVAGRAVEERLRRGQTPTDVEMGFLTRPTTRAKTAGTMTPKSQSVDTSRSHSIESGSDGDGSRRRAMPSPFSIAADRRVSIDSIDSEPSPQVSSRQLAPMNGGARPALETIKSSSMSVPKLHTVSTAHPANARTAKPLQELSPPAMDSTLNSRSPSPSAILAPAANAMPASIPAAVVKVKSLEGYKFPSKVSVEAEGENGRARGDEEVS
ncbi:MAG: hypothetical protein M1818_006652 [Claussenomyces sp. TS43310]|nr:MAG: hypothetical protein M1818_006915 [Claussenomyces sp. TS43310]KAI9735075.1 MAG: hypothetical protein M1818_006652 [Claussenomyces sp. TS43310]